ncbi:hypothetical protein ACLTEW_26125 [Gordonia lacunae]|uniref:hypothetical protein n=1 Tax=Gordonia TaxID=2053 RepID=UPI00200B511A|nr:hypothetical protein [Gordonia terrae]UPW11952.1 hypothetical protein M1C59_25680 [Gordonia terrae]
MEELSLGSGVPTETITQRWGTVESVFVDLLSDERFTVVPYPDGDEFEGVDTKTVLGSLHHRLRATLAHPELDTIGRQSLTLALQMPAYRDMWRELSSSSADRWSELVARAATQGRPSNTEVPGLPVAADAAVRLVTSDCYSAVFFGDASRDAFPIVDVAEGIVTAAVTGK